MHAHPYFLLHPRELASSLPRPRARYVITALLAIGLVVLSLILVIATPQGGAERVPASPAGPAGPAGTPLLLPGGIPAVAYGGVVHAPDDYAPPGIWTHPSGPGPVGSTRPSRP
jgi:hypothetical protein